MTPPDSLKTIFDNFISDYKKDPSTPNKILFLKHEKVIEDIPLSTNEEQLPIFAMSSGTRAHRLKYHKAIFIVESSVRLLKPEDVQESIENWETERPNLYPESQREHMIFFTVLNCKSKQVQIWTKNVKDLSLDYISFPPKGIGINDMLISFFISGYLQAKSKLK